MGFVWCCLKQRWRLSGYNFQGLGQGTQVGSIEIIESTAFSFLDTMIFRPFSGTMVLTSNDLTCTHAMLALISLRVANIGLNIDAMPLRPRSCYKTKAPAFQDAIGKAKFLLH